jgi:predicted amidohydrolase YtcJ
LILHSGRIATQDQRQSFASAAAIKGDRFLAVGGDQDVLAYRGNQTQVIDVGGRTVIPGLYDSHCT